jgi:hypothetical protein
MTINLVKLKRSEVFAYPDQHGDRERVFVVPQLCQTAIGKGLHEFFDRIGEGVVKAYLDFAQVNGIRISLSRWRGGVATTNGYKPTNGSAAVRTLADKTSASTLDLRESDELVEVSNRRSVESLLIDTKILFVGRTGCLTNRIAEAKHALSYMDLQ